MKKMVLALVVTKESKLLLELKNVLENMGNPLEPYRTRMIETFPFRDGKNCERVYEAILELDRPDTTEIPVDTIMDYAQQAVANIKLGILHWNVSITLFSILLLRQCKWKKLDK